jgi:hypothetical protein
MLNTEIKNGSFVSVNQESLLRSLEYLAETKGLHLRERTISKAHLKAAKGDQNATQNFYTLRSNTIVDLNDSPVAPMIQVRDQTYAGSKLVLRLGLWRQICSNGLFGFSVQTEERIAHYKKNEDTLKALDDTISGMFERSSGLIMQVQDLQQRQIDWRKVISQLDLPPKVLAELTQILWHGTNRPQDNPDNVWGLYNIVNEIDRRMARRNSIAYLDRDNRMLDLILKAA